MTSPVSERLHDAMRLRSSYKTAFSGDSGQIVLRDLMRRGFIARSPIVAGDRDQTMANIGMQRMVQSIMRFVYRTDDDLRKEIEAAYNKETI
jgi:hypothetical protein